MRSPSNRVRLAREMREALEDRKHKRFVTLRDYLRGHRSL